MSALSEFDDVVEVERYELTEESRYHFEFDRREFLKVFSGGIALIIPLARMFGQEGERQGQTGESGRGAFNQRVPNEIGAWIHIDEDGGITV